MGVEYSDAGDDDQEPDPTGGVWRRARSSGARSASYSAGWVGVHDTDVGDAGLCR